MICENLLHRKQSRATSNINKLYETKINKLYGATGVLKLDKKTDVWR
jgi:hypothetical protein